MKAKYFIFVVIFICFCVFSINGEAQLWEPIPPYNVLWPLWSPALSPPDPVTGAPTPLVSYLNENTILPVQPALVWNPYMPYFNLIYNKPLSTGTPQLMYYDPTEYSVFYSGYYSPFQPWPPSYLNQRIEVAPGIWVEGPAPITLPTDYQYLSFDPIMWLDYFVPLVNSIWQDYHGINPYLLTAPSLYPPTWIYEASYSLPISVI